MDEIGDHSSLWGTKCKPYRMVICGGGPAGVSIILRAIRIGMFTELCQPQSLYNDDESEEFISCEGICIIEKGSTESFGGGRLLSYVINSNTYGDQFVNVVCEEKTHKVPPETVTETCLERFLTSETSKYLQTFEARVCPLYKVGTFLSEVGASIQDLFENIPSCKCETNTEVLQVQRQENKLWRVKIKTKESTSNMTANSNDNLNELLPLATFIYSKYVVFATGGTQKLPFLSDPNHTKKFIASDDLCTDAGVSELTVRLLKTSRRKVVIIGGSHSAFSALWVCLNKVSTENSPNEAILFPPSSIIILHRGPIRVFYSSRKEAEADGCKDIVNIDHHGHVHPFSGLRGDSKVLYQNIRDGRETRARMVYLKASIGDSTQPLPSLLSKLFDEAVAIVWACGYSSNMVPVLDEKGVPIPIRFSNGQVEVDNKARLLAETDINDAKATGSPCKSLPLEGLFGTGLGFGLRPETPAVAKGGVGGTVALSRLGERADGVAVYMKRAATLVLGSVLGTKVYGEGASSWEERETLRLQRKAQEKADASNLSVEASGDVVEKVLVAGDKDDSDVAPRRGTGIVNSVAKSSLKRLTTHTISPASPHNVASVETKRSSKLPSQLRSLVSPESVSKAVALGDDKLDHKNGQVIRGSPAGTFTLSHSESARVSPTQNTMTQISPFKKASVAVPIILNKSPIKRTPLQLSHTSLGLAQSLGSFDYGRVKASYAGVSDDSQSLSTSLRVPCRASTASSRQKYRQKK